MVQERNITYPAINIYNYMTMKIIVLESITLNPYKLWKQHYHLFQWDEISHHLEKKQSAFLVRK